MPSLAKRSAAHLAEAVGVLALTLSGLSLFVSAATAQHANVRGVVSDTETGAVIGSALVTVGGTGVETPVDTWTDDDGTFEFSSLPAGPVSVRVEAAGYPIIVEDMELDADATHLLYIHLPTVYAILEELLVVGRAPSRGAARTAADLLEREVPGFDANQGVPGSNESPISFRRSSSLGRFSREPAIYVDGVRVGGGALEVLSQIPAASVKSVRIERGPASTSVPLSASGVIYIETRLGLDDER